MATRTRAGAGRAGVPPDGEELLEFLADPDGRGDGLDACVPAFREKLREDLWRLVQRLYGGKAPERDEAAQPLRRPGRRG